MQRHFLKDFNDFGGIYVTKEHGKKKNRLEGIARFIVEKRKAIYLIYILLAIFCCFSAGWVSVDNTLTDYLAERGIPYAVASRYCCRLNYGVRGKRYFAVGFPNVAGGYEIRSRFFKGCVPPKDVSLVKAEGSPADVCSVFEGFMDFLSAATLGLEKGDCLVLNSVANVEKAMRYLDGYGCIDCYLDHDAAGRRTLKTLKGHYGERVYDRSALYDGCKDLNEYLQLTTKKEQ